MRHSITVIVTASGAPGGPSIIKGLRSVKERTIKIVATDIRNDAAGLYLADKAYIVPPGNDPTYIDKMLNIAINEQVDAILPLSSIELPALSKNKELFEDKGVKVLTSNYNSTLIALDKYKTYQYLNSKGISVAPTTYLVQTLDELKSAAQELGFPAKPFVIKQPRGKGQRGFRVITNYKMTIEQFLESKPYDINMPYESLINMLKEAESFPPLMVMEYLPGPEYTVDVLCYKGETIVAIPRLRKQTTLGISTVGVAENKEEIIGLVKDIVEAFNFDYIVNMQFKYNETGEPKLLEINPRIAGTVCLSIEAGVNIPYLAIKLALGEEIKKDEIEVKWGTIIIRYWDHVTIKGS